MLSLNHIVLILKFVAPAKNKLRVATHNYDLAYKANRKEVRNEYVRSECVVKVLY